MNKKRILIGLDFDGVLHNKKTLQFEYVFNLINILNQLLLNNIEVDIVLTTNWRHSSNKSFLNHLKSANRFIIGQTPNIALEKRDLEFLTFKKNYEKKHNFLYNDFYCIDDRQDFFLNDSSFLYLIDKNIALNEENANNFYNHIIDKLKNNINNSKLNKI